MKAPHLLLAALAVASVSCTSLSPLAATMTKASQAATTPSQAQQKLMDGNARFVAHQSLHRDHLRQMKDTSHGQFPFATVVSCIDSRTSSEIIFDQGIGDVFNARVAGNVVDSDILGSLEFASKVAGSKLIAVIGHTHCGAIKGACDHVRLGNLTALLDKIEPAVAATSSRTGELRTSKNDAFVDRVAETHVRKQMQAIRQGSALLRQMDKDGQIKLISGLHDIETGKVTFFN